jgi:uncharacterized membrane protein YwzB
MVVYGIYITFQTLRDARMNKVVTGQYNTMVCLIMIIANIVVKVEEEVSCP